MKKILLLAAVCALLGSTCLKSDKLYQGTAESEDVESIQTLGAGIKRQLIIMEQDNSKIEMIAYILDEGSFTADINQNDDPRTITDWAAETDADLIINGGYFDENYKPTGIMIKDGKNIGGPSYDLQLSGFINLDGGIDIIDTSVSPLPLVKNGLQSFPFLIKDGQEAIQTDSGRLGRRTALAKTNDDKILILVVDKTPLSLYDFMKFLLNSDLDIKNAINLDGGQSTALYANIGEFSEEYLSLTPLPQVISFRF